MATILRARPVSLLGLRESILQRRGLLLRLLLVDDGDFRRLGIMRIIAT
jgi:hypothetical protein